MIDPGQKDIERALFFAEDPRVAKRYGPVTQYVARAENPAQIDWKSVSGSRVYNSDPMNKIVETARGKGHDLIVVKGLEDMGGMQNQVLVVNPSQLRLPNALFDPSRINENNLLGGLAGGGMTGLAVLESERERR